MVDVLDSLFLPDEIMDFPSSKYDKKRRHQVTEQKGRQKINVQILDLKNLLPECKFVPTTKASVLECASSTIRRLHSLSSTLTTQNKALVRDNRKLLAELNRLRESGVFVQNITCEEGVEDLYGDASVSPDQLFLGNSPVAPVDPFSGTINIMGNVSLPSLALPIQPLSTLADDPFFIDYCTPSPVDSPQQSSPGNSSPLTQSPSHSPFATRFSGSDLSSPDTSDTDFDPSGFTRFTKRRLMFVFLFMVPLFFTFENIIGAAPIDLDNKSTMRATLGEHEDSRVLSISHYWDIIRLIWFVVGGVMGTSWIVGTFIWANKLSEEYSYNDTKPKKVVKKADPLSLKKKALKTTARMRSVQN